MRFDINHFNKFIHRAPLLPINTYYKASDMDINSFLKNFFSNQVVLTSLFNSSTDFYNEITYFMEGKYDDSSEKLNKFYSKAIKYANRMCTRPTPFGGFSGCTVGDIDHETIIDRKENGQFIRKHRLDYEFLYSIVDFMLKETDIKKYIKFYPNNSIYPVGDKYRYVDFNSENGELNYLLSSLEQNEYLEDILKMSENGTYYDDILNHLLCDGNEKEECIDFLEGVIDSKFIISEIHPNTIGIEFQYHILNVLERIVIKEGLEDEIIKNIYDTLKNIIQKLDAFADKDYTIDEIQEIMDFINSLPVGFSTKNHIQIDTLIQYEKNILSYKEIQEIKKGLRDYYKISQTSFENRRLQNFIKKFEERYEDTPVKLLEVIDPEFGIGYGDYSNEFMVLTPIIDNVPINDKSSGKGSFVWENKIHSLMFKKVFEAHKNNKSEISFTEEEIDGFEFDIKDIPSSFVAFFNIYNSLEGRIYNLKSWGSDTGTSIIGRFSTLDESFHNLLIEMDEFEKNKLNDNQILAEVNHLSGLRVGNITTRTNFREYEIPYVTVENNNGLKKINPNDIYVRVFSGHVRIFDIKSGKEIIPILSNAHNFNNNPLPLYRFLSDIQNHSQINNLYLNINLGIITTLFTHIPRITYKNFIFRPATWSLQSKNLKTILQIKDKEERIASLLQVFKEQNIPTRFYITDGDNKLFLDFENLYQVSEIILKDEIRKKETIMVEEYIPQSYKGELQMSNGDFYCNEMVIPFKNNYSKTFEKTNFEQFVDIALEKKENIHIGTNCLYLKIYLGTISRNKVVNEKLLYFIDTLKIENLFDHWFFIRFSENNTPHIRVRFFKDKIDYNRILEIYNQLFAEEILSDIIYKSEITIYKKELIRYGGYTLMDYAEKIFEKDSELFLTLNPLLEEYGLNDYYWIFIMKMIDVYFEAFGLSEKQKLSFSTENKVYFAEKFNSDQTQKNILNNNYKDNKDKIEEFLNDDYLKINYPSLFDLFDNFLSNLNFIVKDSYSNNSEKLNYLMSFIHMSLLRSTISKNVKHEYVLYCFLEMFYKKRVYAKND